MLVQLRTLISKGDTDAYRLNNSPLILYAGVLAINGLIVNHYPTHV